MDLFVSFCSHRAGCAVAIGALAIGAPAPAFADVAVPARIIPVPIIPPPFVVVPEPTVSREGTAPDRLTLVVGAALGSDYEGSDDYIFAPVAGATARLHGHSIGWQGNSLGVDLVTEHRDQTFKFIVAPFVNLNLDLTRVARDPVVARIGKRMKAVEGGVVIGFTRTGVLTSPSDSLTIQLSAAQDLGSAHRSFIVSPSVIYVAPLSKAMLVSASASLDGVGAGYARYYFGIDGRASAASGLPFYRPGGGVKSAAFSLGGVISLRGDLSRGFAVGAKLNYARLLGAFASSPLVAMRGNANQFSVAVGLAYTF